MSQTFEGLSILHPDYMLPIALKRLQGEFVGKYFLPDRQVKNLTYRWRYYGVVGGMTPKVAENDKGPLIHTRYEQRVGRVEPFKERDLVSDFTDMVEGRNIVKDSVENLTERFALRQEWLRIHAIIDACYMNIPAVASDAENYFWVDLDNGGKNWEGGSGPVDIVKDLIHAKTNVKKYAKVVPDTMLCSPDVVEAIKNNTGMKQWDRYGPLTQRLIKDDNMIETNVPGSHGRLAGLEIFEANADILTDNEDEKSALTPIVGDDAYIFKRGKQLGAMHVLKGLFTRSKHKLMRDATEIQVGGIMACDIFRPQFIFGYKNAVSL